MWGRMGEGSGNRFGEPRPDESWWGMAGVSWHCGGGHMEGRLALWLPPERAPADGWGGICQEKGKEGGREGGRRRGHVCAREAGFFFFLFLGALLKAEDCHYRTGEDPDQRMHRHTLYPSRRSHTLTHILHLCLSRPVTSETCTASVPPDRRHINSLVIRMFLQPFPAYITTHTHTHLYAHTH